MHNVQKVAQDIYWIGGNDFISTRFENLIPISNGVAYNSYFIDDEMTAVVDTVDAIIRDVFMDKVKYLLRGRKLDYIIINHMEPDHSGSLRALSELHPEAKIVASQPAQKMIDQYFHGELKDRTYITSDEKLEISLGKHKLKFIKAPMVHWPEVTFTYEETEKILFSADAFGTFGVLNGSVFADDTDYFGDYLPESRKYYANIVSRYGMQVLAALKKIENLDISMICSLHGPVLREKSAIDCMVGQYKKWASWDVDYESVNIFFASTYGNTALAAEDLAMILGKKGIKNIKLVDVCMRDATEAFTEVLRRRYMVLMAPTVNMGLNPRMVQFMNICSEMEIKNRKVAIVGNSSWAPFVSTKLMMEKVKGWKNCEILGEPYHFASALSHSDEGIEKLAQVIVDDIKGSQDK